MKNSSLFRVIIKMNSLQKYYQNRNFNYFDSESTENKLINAVYSCELPSNNFGMLILLCQ